RRRRSSCSTSITRERPSSPAERARRRNSTRSDSISTACGRRCSTTPDMALGDRIRRRRRGGFDLRLPESERELLRSLPDQLRQLLETEDPSTKRLYPPGHADDDELEAEYRAMTRQDLTEERLESLRV